MAFPRAALWRWAQTSVETVPFTFWTLVSYSLLLYIYIFCFGTLLFVVVVMLQTDLRHQSNAFLMLRDTNITVLGILVMTNSDQIANYICSLVPAKNLLHASLLPAGIRPSRVFTPYGGRSAFCRCSRIFHILTHQSSAPGAALLHCAPCIFLHRWHAWLCFRTGGMTFWLLAHSKQRPKPRFSPFSSGLQIAAVANVPVWRGSRLNVLIRLLRSVYLADRCV